MYVNVRVAYLLFASSHSWLFFFLVGVLAIVAMNYNTCSLVLVLAKYRYLTNTSVQCSCVALENGPEV